MSQASPLTVSCWRLRILSDRPALRRYQQGIVSATVDGRTSFLGTCRTRKLNDHKLTSDAKEQRRWARTSGCQQKQCQALAKRFF